jgi:hypothetical protein
VESSFKEMRPSGKKLGHWGHTLEKDIETLAPFLFLLSLPHQPEVSSLLHNRLLP